MAKRENENQNQGAANRHDKLRVTFIAPRFHTNQVGLVSYLLREGAQVSFFTSGIGKSEYHKEITPKLISFINHARLQRRVKNFSKNPWLNLYRKGIPHAGCLIEILRSRPSIAIIRNPISTVGLLSSLLLKVRGTTLVFYTQAPLHRKHRRIKDRVLNMLARTMSASWITPCRGDTALEVPLKNARFLPFSMTPHRYMKDWFQDDKISIMMVGKFLPRKRHDLLLRALSKLPYQYQDAFRVTLVGEASDVTGDETLHSLRELASTLKFEVDFLINISYEETLSLYERHDLFILPSENEPASISNLEAMSYGLPTIVSSCNGTSDYAGASGWVFECGSESDLLRVLKDSLGNRNELKRRGGIAWDITDQELSPYNIYMPFFDHMTNTKNTNQGPR